MPLVLLDKKNELLEEWRRSSVSAIATRFLEILATGSSIERASAVYAAIEGRHFLRSPKIRKQLNLQMPRIAKTGFLQNRVSERRLQNVAGNYYFKTKKADLAEHYFQLALVGDTDPNRMGLVRLNLSRLHFSLGRIKECLDTLSGVKLEKISEGKIRYAILLMQVRLYFVLGFHKHSRDALRQTRSTSPRNSSLELERKYLGLVLRLVMKDDASRIEEFSGWVENSFADEIANLYLLESLVMMAIANISKFRNRERLWIRVRYLAKGQPNQSVSLAKKALALPLSRFELSVTREFVREATRAYKSSSAFSAIVYTAQLIRRSIAMRKWEASILMIEAFNVYLHSRVTLNSAVSNRLRSEDSEIDKMIDGWVCQIPTKYRSRLGEGGVAILETDSRQLLANQA